ncbi:bacteriorhodopsin [Deinococcus sp. YIM 134068]|uniref:bacteriorhodopsin n=1 Tax=Deinococcus lichenicola TaxID=3118910 RepID=UPI002F941894
MTSELWLWPYVALMAAGALLFYSWSRDPRGVPQVEYLVAIVIPVWSGLAYTAMALGQGLLEVDGQTTYVPRYLDWVVTTPLLLVALALTAMNRAAQKNWTLLGALIFSDVVMIVSGLVSDLSEGPARTLWYLNGVVAFMIVLALIWGPLRAEAERGGTDLAALYRRVAGFLTALWFAYPTIWAIGPSGFDLIGQTTETALFVIFPFLSKVGFSILDLSGLRRLSTRPV